MPRSAPQPQPQPQPLAPVRKRPLPDPPSSSKRLNPGPTASKLDLVTIVQLFVHALLLSLMAYIIIKT